MLTVNEFSVGKLGLAKPISLLRPRDKYETEVLVVGTEDAPIAVILEGEFSFQWFSSVGNSSWTGIIIPELHIELDETSAFGGPCPIGAAIRHGTELGICAKRERHGGTTYVPMLTDLPALEDQKVGFTRWQLVLGSGLEKRIIRKFEAVAG